MFDQCYVAFYIGGHLAVIFTLVGYCGANHRRFPYAASLLLIAIGFRMLPLFAPAVVSAVGLSWYFFPVIRWRNFPGPDDPIFWRMLSVQVFYALCEIASWSLIAWVVLVRPDERQKEQSKV